MELVAALLAFAVIQGLVAEKLGIAAHIFRFAFAGIASAAYLLLWVSG